MHEETNILVSGHLNLNYNSNQEKEYIQSLIKEDFSEAGDQNVLENLKKI